MVNAAPRLVTLCVLLLGYGAISVACWFTLVPPVAAPLVPIVATLVGPPASLLWGHRGITAFAIASAILFLFAYYGMRSHSHSFAWFGAAVAVLLISGFLSFAVSVG
jgi:membrane-bound metal-dependent hydrolase YbcI (DUF457 family)